MGGAPWTASIEVSVECLYGAGSNRDTAVPRSAARHANFCLKAGLDAYGSGSWSWCQQPPGCLMFLSFVNLTVSFTLVRSAPAAVPNFCIRD